jgi:hypothetical protein
MSKKPAPKSKKTAAARKEDRRTRRVGLAAGIAGAAAVAGAALYALFGPPFRAAENGEHEAPDLAPDAPIPGTDRAPEAFRPDPTAPVPAAEREALRPATGPAPTLVEDRGGMNAQTGPANVANT